MSEPSPRDATGSSDATRPRPPHLGPPRPRTRPGSRAWGGRGGRPRESPPRVSSGTPCTCVAPFRARRCFLLRTPCSRFAAFRARRCSSPRTPCTGFAASRARRCSSPRTPCTCFAPSRARRCFLLRTPCTGFAPSRARRCSSPRTPCTGVEPSRARRCSSPRTPCSCVAPSRARRCPSPRTPCTGVAASRARRSLSPGTPCTSTLPCPCRARTSCRSPPPRPSADASRAPGAWRNARSIVTHDSVAALPEPPTRFGRLKLSGVFGRRRESSKWRGPGRVIVLGRSEAHSRFARSRRWRSCRRASSRARTTRR